MLRCPSRSLQHPDGADFQVCINAALLNCELQPPGHSTDRSENVYREYVPQRLKPNISDAAIMQG